MKSRSVKTIVIVIGFAIANHIMWTGINTFTSDYSGISIYNPKVQSKGNVPRIINYDEVIRSINWAITLEESGEEMVYNNN